MAFATQIDIIHGADEVNLTAYTYSSIYASSASTVVLNGVTIDIPPGVLIPVIVKTISSVPTVYCLGTKTSNFYAPNFYSEAE